MGIIVIGRNEGERLVRCLKSVLDVAAHVVYVDSGSTDASVVSARALGVEVVSLDMSIPFSAARARNEGVARLMRIAPATTYVQFVDGDCEIIDGWIAAAVAALDSEPQIAAVAGRLYERFPEASIYNRLCDMEWDTPIGLVPACGGLCMVRANALAQVGGFNPSVVAGEEPEMCLRLRREGWSIRRIDAKMALHDAAMTRFGQWWKRSVRGGHAYAQAMAMHGRSPDRFGVRSSMRLWLWGAGIPLIALGLAWPTYGLSLLVLLVYPLQVWRIARRRRRDHQHPQFAGLYAFFCVLANFPGCIGQFKYWSRRWLGAGPRIIEYKTAAAPNDAPDGHDHPPVGGAVNDR
ncbi:MAG: glycosyltransferase [Planctomycetes bacterium]|nr:glycosyltransferase [Planctomycetota bacterium]